MFLFLGNHIVQQKALSIIFATFLQYIKFVIIKYIRKYISMKIRVNMKI